MSKQDPNFDFDVDQTYGDFHNPIAHVVTDTWRVIFGATPPEWFVMISTLTGSWIRSRLWRDRIQLPVRVEIITVEFFCNSCVV